jgi:hypothetical protein
MVVRSYAPRGLTPVLEEYLSRDHLAAIGAVTPQGQLFLQTYEQAISSEQVIRFLELLQHQLTGLLLVLWDGSPTHRSKKIKAYLSNGAAKRIHLVVCLISDYNSDRRTNGKSTCLTTLDE